ncbi:Flp family type IVb pilin [Methylorubrum zatmanii]
MKNITKRFIADESGATAIEYGLVAAMMAIAVVAIFGTFKSKLSTAFGTIGDSLGTQANKIGQ